MHHQKNIKMLFTYLPLLHHEHQLLELLELDDLELVAQKVSRNNAN